MARLPSELLSLFRLIINVHVINDSIDPNQGNRNSFIKHWVGKVLGPWSAGTSQTRGAHTQKRGSEARWQRFATHAILGASHHAKNVYRRRLGFLAARRLPL
jgi:hypothetical protein